MPPRISLCMIVKNEEKHLPDCLASCADLVHEIIIVDTGSTDRTKEIAQKHGAKVFDFPWVDDFAAARNVSKKHATGDWIFWMDADDRIDADNRAKLRTLFAGLKTDLAAYMIKCVVVPSAASADPVRIVDHTRLFRNHPKVRWHYRVHEQVLPALYHLGAAIHRTDIVIHHVGYQDSTQRSPKLQRNRKLLELENADRPNDAFTLYNLGRINERMGDVAAAMPHWKRSLELANSKDTFVRKLYWLIAQGHHKLGQRAPMLQACLAGLARFPDEIELLFLVGTVLYESRDLAAAEACLLRLLDTPRGEYFDLGDDVGIRSFKARTQLGRLYRDLKKLPEAETHFREALKEQPTFGPALLGLGQVLIDLKRWPELEVVIATLDGSAHGEIESAVLRGLRHAVRKEFAEAKRVAADAVDKHPQAIELRILNSRLLWRERQSNPSAAQKALHDILALDPGNAEAQRQLEKLKSE